MTELAEKLIDEIVSEGDWGSGGRWPELQAIKDAIRSAAKLMKAKVSYEDGVFFLMSSDDTTAKITAQKIARAAAASIRAQGISQRFANVSVVHQPYGGYAAVIDVSLMTDKDFRPGKWD